MQPDCHRLESELGVTLCAMWLDLLVDYPAELSQLVRPDGERVADADFCSDIDHLLLMNREVRAAPIVDGDGATFDWPKHLLVIGENGAGDYYCIDTQDDDPTVLFFDHQLCEVGDMGEGLIGFLELLIDQFATDEQLRELADKGLLE